MRQNVILDLDNTLLSAEALEDFPFHQKGIKEKALQFNLHDMDGYYVVFERPHVQDFLDWLFQNYNVSVWTAASKDYGLFVLENILLKNNRKLDYFLFSYHCDLSRKKYDYSKKLDLIYDVFKLSGYNASNTIIIDDLEEVHECQPKNSIHIKEFEILNKNSERDQELIKNTKGEIVRLFNKLK